MSQVESAGNHTVQVSPATQSLRESPLAQMSETLSQDDGSQDMNNYANKKFECGFPGCDKAFSRRDYLIRHEANHSSVKPFQCHQCQTGFARKDLLEKHFRSQAHQRKRDDMATSNGKTSMDSTPEEHPEKRLKVSQSPLEVNRLNSLDMNRLTPVEMTRHTPLDLSRLPLGMDPNRIPEGIAQTLPNGTRIFTPPMGVPMPPHQLPPNQLPPNQLPPNQPPPPGGFGNPIPPPHNQPFIQPEMASFYTPPSMAPPSSELHSQSEPGQLDQTDIKGEPAFNNMNAGLADNYMWLFGDYVDSSNDANSLVYSLDESVRYRSSSSQSSATSDATHGVFTHAMISDSTRETILNVLQIEGLEQILTVSRINHYMELYWNKFNTTFPIIHYQTFDPNEVDIFLIVNMVSIGMAHAKDDIEYDYAIKIHKNLRNLLFIKIGDNVLVPLTLLQSLLLDNFFCKYLGDSSQFELSQVFHGTNINLLRYSGYLEEMVEPSLRPPAELTPEECSNQWKEWTTYEACKRTAYFIFMCDALQATLFRHTQTMSTFEIQLELPCTDAVWNATTPERFYKEYRRQPRELLARKRPTWEHKTKISSVPPETNEGTNYSITAPTLPIVRVEGQWPSFLWSLRRLMKPFQEDQKEYPMDCFSQFSRYIFLHGFISICFDMRWRGLLDLGVGSKNRILDLSAKLETAFYNWKGYFDLHASLSNDSSLQHRKEILSTKEPQPVVLNDYGAGPSFWANLTLYQMGLVVLHADLYSVIKLSSVYNTNHKYPKFDLFSQNRFKSVESYRIRETVQNWARSSEGLSAAIESCKFLRLVMNNTDIINTVPHLSWSIWMSCLVLWAYESNRQYDGKVKDSDQRYADPLSSACYFNAAGVIDSNISKRDTLDYFAIVLELENNTDKIVESYESFWRRQQKVIGVVGYSILLMQECRWRNKQEMIVTLESILKSY